MTNIRIRTLKFFCCFNAFSSPYVMLIQISLVNSYRNLESHKIEFCYSGHVVQVGPQHQEELCIMSISSKIMRCICIVLHRRITFPT